ncbi:MAG: sulfotransferase family 2 domain-containing protein [Pseudomonadota bacterium]
MKPQRSFRHTASNPLPLAQNSAHQLASEHALSIYRANAVYSFIPKNACTTMRLSLALANRAISSPGDFLWIHGNNTTFSATMAELVRADYTFVILRCPYARLVSCYLDVIVGRHPPFWQLHEWIMHTVDPEAFSFRAFIHCLTRERLRYLDENWMPQTHLMVYDTYDDVFDMADFSAVGPALKAKIGLDVVDARALSKHGVDQYAPVDDMTPDTTPLDIMVRRAKGEVPRPQTLFDDELIAIVREAYADDVALYAERFPGRLMF